MVTSIEERVVLIDLQHGKEQEITVGSYGYAAWDRECKILALARKDANQIELWSSDGPRKLTDITTESPVRNGLALSSDGRYLGLLF